MCEEKEEYIMRFDTKEEASKRLFNSEVDIEKEFLTVEEIAELLGITRETAYRHLRDGAPKHKNSTGIDIRIRQIPNYYIGGRRYFSRSAFLELVKKNRKIVCPECGAEIQ